MTKKPIDSKNHITVGWREWLALPDLGIPYIKAKIDSGARTSSLHTAKYEIFQRGEQDWVRFTVHPIKHHNEVEHQMEVPVADYRIVRDSGGHEEKRPFIRTTLQVGSQQWEIEVSLANRESMKFRMLLGRTGMRNRISIDCGQSYLTQKKPKNISS
ncbi:ATP-dependent zinc protease [Akkermansiaceae bacterium]|jgi:hypothetical protein|nr:ATP-dependent zinc protease [Akkermansiaceae bacterium]MDA7935985.1 ATP-dependent zinc protease [bacterium]MDA7519526.1 ATP-dependent zinc protease [Akkermansiaceae bacterium]MDA7538372.1 ATP-dependent zinc protease [Akkermansiaceae bacterium]MDA7648931.1 ATP-dependent zinc protease [Akkermansiaceae bacterium]